MPLLVRHVRRFSSENGLRSTDAFPAPVLGRRWEPLTGRRHLLPYELREALVCASEGNHRGAPLTLAVLREPLDDTTMYYICAATPLGVGLAPTAIGHRWLVGGDRLGPPLPTEATTVAPPRRLDEYAAYHQTIEVRSLDERSGQVLADSSLVEWFQDGERQALAFEVPLPHLLVGVGGAGAWDRNVDGFVDTLLEFRDMLTDVLRRRPER